MFQFFRGVPVIITLSYVPILMLLARKILNSVDKPPPVRKCNDVQCGQNSRDLRFSWRLLSIKVRHYREQEYVLLALSVVTILKCSGDGTTVLAKDGFGSDTYLGRHDVRLP